MYLVDRIVHLRETYGNASAYYQELYLPCKALHTWGVEKRQEDQESTQNYHLGLTESKVM